MACPDPAMARLIHQPFFIGKIAREKAIFHFWTPPKINKKYGHPGLFLRFLSPFRPFFA
jgi:hypothetical protein